MYSVSDEARSLLSENYRQIVKITCNGLENEFELTESDIAQGGLSVNRYCVSGDKIEIGSAVASELTLKLDNRDDRFSETVFEGAELQVQLGIKKWDAYRWENAQIQWIPLGYFTVDETPRKLSYITLSALDRMVRFDKEVTENDITFPIKISSLLSVCCTNCNVPLKTIPTFLLNADYVVTKFPDYDELTYRRLIQWIAEISGTCAFVDWNGELCLSGYSLDTDFSITPSDRYSSDMYEQDITITGVQISDDNDNVYLAGTDDYAFNIENNGLIQSNHLEIATAIFNKVKDIVYRPYTCTCKPLPYVYPLDGVSYTDKNGIAHKSIVTGITFKMNASTTLEGKGETQTKNGYASANPLTKAESVVLKKLENRVNRKISNYEQASLDMNEMISNSLGLYRTEIVEENGSTTYYYHNEPTLSESSIIYTFNAGGFAWTTEWENENTVWNYGITKDGNAVYNILSAFKIQSELLETGCVTAEKLSVEYKKSVVDAIDDAKADVTQAFTVADGVLDSRITAEVTRAENAESTLSSRITQTSESITAEVLRATTAEGDLLSKINVTADAITAEVTRAENAESTLSSRIDLQASKLSLVVEEVNGVSTIATASIVAAINDGESDVKISADHIELTGEVTIIASKSDIPTKTSQLTNNSGFATMGDVNYYLGSSSSTTYKKVVSIIDGTVTADYIEAIGITANALVVKDSSGNVLLGAGDNKVDIAGFSVSGNSFTNVDSDGYGVKITNESLSVSKCLAINSSTYTPMGVELSGVDGLLTIFTYPIPGNDYYTYVPLLKFISSYSDPFGDGYYIAEYRYLCARKYNTSTSWSLCITKSLDFPNGAGNSITVL